MGKQFVKTLMENKRVNIETGIFVMGLIMFCSCENVLDKYVDEEKISDCIKELEADANRIWEEECKADPDIAADLLVGHVRELRKKHGMEEMFE